jgi:hypothetical protein
MLNRPVPAWLAVAVVIVLAAGLAWKTGNPVYDPDTWWHLKVGEWVAEHQSVPETDPFSRMSRETPAKWVAYSWLFEVGLYELQTVSPGGVYWMRAALIGLSAAALLGFVLGRIGTTRLGVLAAVAAAATLLPLTTERPWHVTIAFTTVTLAAVMAGRESGSVRRIAWLPLLFALWANVHVQFVLGWGVLGLACLFPGAAKRSHVVALTAACGVVVLVNPYHVRLLGVVWEYATQAQALRLVRELNPPAMTDPVAWVVVGLSILAFVHAVRARDGFAVLLVAAGAFFALRMQRDMWFGVLTAAAALGTKTGIRAVMKWGLGILAIVCVLCVAAVIGRQLHRPDHVNEDEYPVRAATFVRDHHPPGPLFNHFDWGGYLIWALPDYPVSIDGRTNLYGNDRLSQNHSTFLGERGWANDPDLKSARLAILPVDCPLAGLLRDANDWSVAFEDETAVVFVR